MLSSVTATRSKGIRRVLGAAALLGIMALATAQAETLLETTASSPTLGLTNSNSGPPPSLVESILDYNNGNSLQAHASADTSGASAVSASGILINGQTGPFRSYASAKITQVAQNNSGAPIDYQFDFSLVGPYMDFYDTLGAAAFYSAAIKLNGAEIWNSSATLNGAYFGAHSLIQTGTDLVATFTGVGSHVGYQFGNYSNVLALGTFPDGSTVTVEAFLEVWFEAPGFEIAGVSRIGDPNDLSSSSGFGGTLSAVPEPATIAYMILGSLMLVSQLRRTVRR